MPETGQWLCLSPGMQFKELNSISWVAVMRNEPKPAHVWCIFTGLVADVSMR